MDESAINQFMANIQLQQMMQQMMRRNQQYSRPGPYSTMLMPSDEVMFRNWLQANNVPFNPNSTGPQDYDMRGFYQAMQQKDPIATSAINPNDQRMHYPDFWKTPYHQSFSAGSQWANPGAPTWNQQDQLVDRSGNVLFDERRRDR